MTLYLLRYNNYFNRIIRKEDDLEGYAQYQIGYPIPNINFIPNDNINTTQIINWDLEDPDYLLVVDENNNIVSRWYIMSTTRVRNGQLKLQLHRDVLADYRDETLASTAYVRKGSVLPDYMQDLIYNSEGVAFNQIKTREDLLFDKTNTAWIVGYVDPTVADLQSATIDYSAASAPFDNYETLKQYEERTIQVMDVVPEIYIFAGKVRNPKYSFRMYRYSVVPGANAVIDLSKYFTEVNEDLVYHSSTWNYYVPWNNMFDQPTEDPELVRDYITARFKNQANAVLNGVATAVNLPTENEYNKYKNGVVTDGQNYYQILVEPVGSKRQWLMTHKNSNTKLFNQLKDTLFSVPTAYLSQDIMDMQQLARNSNGPYIGLIYTTTEYKLTLKPITYGDAYIKFGTDGRRCEDAPYKMFCMKYTPKNYMLAIQMATNNGDFVYDVQILPYCPVQEHFNDDGSLNLSNATEGQDYEKITLNADSTEAIDYLFWAKKSAGTFDINYKIELDNIKQNVNCDLYRLCSPNGNGMFEFNAARNGGVEKINVDYSYKPYDPYIHLNPNWGKLYGPTDFDDFRGLILNGDFSLPWVKDAWTQYTIYNKNYQNIFDREVQSLELQNKYAKTQDVMNAITGTFQGGISGAMAGSAAGPYGAIAGAVIGTAAGAIGGALDVEMNEQLRQDQMDLRKTLFSYNLQNIQAIPKSITKTGCITNNNKLVPYIEYYTCTDAEKEVFASMLKYTGMTIGATGILGDYVLVGIGVDGAQYVEADIIKLDINEDFHVAMEIANEIRRGVRFA